MSERDYSEVTWPWDDDPNWAAPREGATYDKNDQNNWALACGVCALQFPMDIIVQTMADHWDELHSAEHGSSEDGNIELQLVWIGLGTPPTPPQDVRPGGS